MKLIRTFVAVLIGEDLKARTAEVQEQVRKLAPDVKWVAPENLHVTMKFLGNVREDALANVFAAVGDAARTVSPFNLSISGLGAFPTPRRARVVWVGIQDGVEQLRKLADSADNSLARLGFEKEQREFKAHITIGRVKISRYLDKLAEGIGEIDASNLGVQRITSIAVMQSELHREGPAYTPCKVIELFQEGTP